MDRLVWHYATCGVRTVDLPECGSYIMDLADGIRCPLRYGVSR